MFKYMPLRGEFFTDPLLRITPALELNDVFELQPTQEVKDDVEYVQSIGVLNKTKAIENSFVAHINDQKPFHLAGIGIISFTKNPYNILMWSHYAREHKGMVIEFSPVIGCDLPFLLTDDVKKTINQQLRPFGFHSMSAYEKYDSKLQGGGGFTHLHQPYIADVLYENVRPGSGIDYGVWYYNEPLIRRIQTTKSEHWRYESEVRIVSPIRFADIAIININTSRFGKCPRGNFADFEGELSRCSNAVLMLLKAAGVVYKRVSPLSYVVERISREVECENISMLLFEYIKNEAYFSGFLDIMFFKRCLPNAISSVFFGARVNPSERYKALKSIMDSERIEYQKVNFYQAMPSQNRFEIEFTKLKPEDLPWDIKEPVDDEERFYDMHVRY